MEVQRAKEKTSRPKAKKIKRVATVFTGVAAGAAGMMVPATPAMAATQYYQAVVLATQGEVNIQVCGYNQYNTWICTGEKNATWVSTGGGYGVYAASWPNWWFRGYTRVWWGGHGRGSWNQCSIPTTGAGPPFDPGTTDHWVHPGWWAALNGVTGNPSCNDVYS
jgi:hypothetical protein